MNTVLVEFTIGKTKIKTEAIFPKGNNSEEGAKIMTINNAIQNVSRDLGIDLRDIENIHDLAIILY